MTHRRQHGTRVARSLPLLALITVLLGSIAWERNEDTEARAAVTQQVTQCSSFFEPEHPLELNTVVVGRLVKTIAMEKEEIRCIQAPTGITVQVYDVEVFVEIVEQAANGRVRPIQKRVELAVCAKDIRPQRTPPGIRCRASDVPLQNFADPFVGCGRADRQPRDPVEMNTVVLRDALIKTVKVEKELFDCDGPVVELFLFTEIVESGRTTRLAAVSKTFEAILCRKERATIERAPAVRCMQLPT